MDYLKKIRTTGKLRFGRKALRNRHPAPIIKGRERGGMAYLTRDGTHLGEFAKFCTLPSTTN
jgi:hypothetical protein